MRSTPELRSLDATCVATIHQCHPIIQEVSSKSPSIIVHHHPTISMFSRVYHRHPYALCINTRGLHFFQPWVQHSPAGLLPTSQIQECYRLSVTIEERNTSTNDIFSSLAYSLQRISSNGLGILHSTGSSSAQGAKVMAPASWSRRPVTLAFSGLMLL